VRSNCKVKDEAPKKVDAQVLDRLEDYAASTDRRESEEAKRMAGSQKTTQETFVDLHEHSIGLRRLANWDRGAPLLATGTLLLGASIGALAAGSRFISAGVLACGASGIAFLVGGILLRDERIRSARHLHEAFERRLALYDDDPDLKAIKERLAKVEKNADEERLIARLRRHRKSHPG